jgi:RNA polymerase sigma-70 factor (ECF subfamily)
MLNTVRNFWRRHKNPRPISIEAHDGEHSARQEPEADVDSPLDSAVREEHVRTVRSAVASLEPQLREIIVLRDIQGFRYEELVEIVGVPAGTVKSRLHRARLALKDKLAPLYAETE